MGKEEFSRSMEKVLILQASARSDGNTHKIIQSLRQHLTADVIDLKTKHIEAYTYDKNKPVDDFLPLMRNIVEQYELLIFATPVYWYSMSGILKNFLDRLTDCMSVEKQLGRKLKHKKLASLACGSDAAEVEGFHLPFQLTAAYLDMKYIGSVHTWIEDNTIIPMVEQRILAFANTLNRN